MRIPDARRAVPGSSWRRLPAGLLWTAPWWLGFLFFLAVPLGASLYLSFCDYTLLQPPAFIGWANYLSLASDADFGKVVFNTLVYSLLAVPLGAIVAVALALLLNRTARGQAFFRACVFLPTIVPLTAAAMVWMWMLNPQAGLVNEPFRWAGMSPPNWFDRPAWAMAALVLISLWFVGSPTVIYLAGLQEIPLELYEAAELDGASPWGRFRNVTLPGLGPVVLFNVIIAILTAWQIFALPYILWRTQKGPDGATYFYAMYIYDAAFRDLRMGYASAMAWVQLLIILLMTGLVFWIGRRTVHYRGA
ncbi:MAG: sugar ABC transporter permease [Phycisphaerae bacterium]